MFSALSFQPCAILVVSDQSLSSLFPSQLSQLFQSTTTQQLERGRTTAQNVEVGAFMYLLQLRRRAPMSVAQTSFDQWSHSLTFQHSGSTTSMRLGLTHSCFRMNEFRHDFELRLFCMNCSSNHCVLQLLLQLCVEDLGVVESLRWKERSVILGRMEGSHRLESKCGCTNQFGLSLLTNCQGCDLTRPSHERNQVLNTQSGYVALQIV